MTHELSTHVLKQDEEIVFQSADGLLFTQFELDYLDTVVKSFFTTENEQRIMSIYFECLDMKKGKHHEHEPSVPSLFDITDEIEAINYEIYSNIATGQIDRDYDMNPSDGDSYNELVAMVADQVEMTAVELGHITNLKFFIAAVLNKHKAAYYVDENDEPINGEFIVASKYRKELDFIVNDSQNILFFGFDYNRCISMGNVMNYYFDQQSNDDMLLLR
jgi:hypothetical protein